MASRTSNEAREPGRPVPAASGWLMRRGGAIVVPPRVAKFRLLMCLGCRLPARGQQYIYNMRTAPHPQQQAGAMRRVPQGSHDVRRVAGLQARAPVIP